MTRLINPPKYDIILNGSSPAYAYSLNASTHFRSLARPENMTAAYQVEATYKYDYGEFKVDWGLRTYDDDFRQFNTILVTDKGIYKEDITRSVLDDEHFMRWTVFVTKIAERKPHLFITTEPDSGKITFFYPEHIIQYAEDENIVMVVDTEGIAHPMEKTERLVYAFEHENTDYIDIREENYIPIYKFRMWYEIF